MDRDLHSSPPRQTELLHETPLAFKPLSNQMLSDLQSLFPTQLDFYHLGQLELYRRSHRGYPQEQKILYTLEGDLRGQFLISFPQNQDSSLYLEIGNVLLGRFTTQLSELMNLDVLFSPPQVLSAKNSAYPQHQDGSHQTIRLNYRFSKPNLIESFDADLEIFRLKETGHA